MEPVEGSGSTPAGMALGEKPMDRSLDCVREIHAD
jgi:hypothetical protein